MPIYQMVGYFEVPYVRRICGFLVDFEMKPQRESVSKSSSNVALKVAKRSNRSFAVYLMNHLVQTSIFYICDNAMYRT